MAKEESKTAAEGVLELFAACAPGLEPLLALEVAALGLAGEVQAGGVSFRGTARDLLRANLWLRCAGRLLARLGTLRATTFPELVKRARELPFERVLRPGAPVAMKATCRKSRLYHSDAVIERVHAAIELRMGKSSPLVAAAVEENESDEAEAPSQSPQLFLIRFERDECTISADASGALLHRRGYRAHLSRAPLRETLAAALLLAAGYRGGPVLDPFCGGGTIPIEAALIAQNRAPGLRREFACESWPGAKRDVGEQLRAEARAQEKPLAADQIRGSDLDPEAIVAAQTNSRAAGLEGLLNVSARDLTTIRAADLAPNTLLIANPPYGKRAGAPGPELLNLWRAFGALARAHGGPAALLCPSNDLARAAGWTFKQQARTQNGGLPVSLLVAAAKSKSL